MSYAAVSDVQGLNAKRTAYSTSTKPTLTQVQGFVDQISAEIDAVLAAKNVATPVTAPASFVTFLLGTNALGAAALAEAAEFPEFDGGPGFTPQAQRYWAMYQSRLDELKLGAAIDPAVTVSDADNLARTYLTDNPDNLGFDGSDGFTDGQQPVFSIGRDGVDY